VIIEELVAVLGIEVDKQKMQKAQGALDKTRKSFIGIKTAVLGAAVGIFEFERRMLKGIFQMDRSSKLLGITTKEFQTLELAANKSGTSVESVTGAVSQLDSALAGTKIGKFPTELAAGLGRLSQFTGEEIGLFRADGGLKEGLELFQEIGQALESVTDRQKRAALSIQLFGQNITPVFAELAGARKDIDKFGLSLSPEKMATVNAAMQKMAILSAQIKVLFQELAVELTPLFDALISVFASDEVRAAMKFMVTSLKFIVDLITKVIKAANQLGDRLGKALLKSGAFRALDNLIDGIKSLQNFSFSDLNPFSSGTSNTTTNNQTQNTYNNDNQRNTTINNITKSGLPSVYLTGGTM
jgi:hypothetical protein